MGYTHYFEIVDEEDPRWKSIWPQLVQDVVKIVEAADTEISGPTTHDDTVTPILADVKKGIYLNGVGYGAHEPLVIGSGSWGFVKTNQKPYDAVVTCVLLRAHTLAPEVFGMSSDGSWEEWIEGRNLYKRIWPDEKMLGPNGEEGPAQVNTDNSAISG